MTSENDNDINYNYDNINIAKPAFLGENLDDSVISDQEYGYGSDNEDNARHTN